MKEQIKRLIVVTIKAVLYALLTFVFFFIFSKRNIGLVNLSRTFVITLFTFLVVGVLMIMVYGNFEIGVKKSKPIIYSTVISVFITDILTYIQLMVMNTNPHNNVYFKLEQLDLLLLVFIVQVLIICFFSYFGNYVYFKIFDPLDTIVIYGGKEKSLSLKKIIRYIKSYKLQYNLVGVISADDVDIESKIKNSDYIFMLDLDSNTNSELINLCYEHDKDFSFKFSISDVIQHSSENVVIDDIPMAEVSSSNILYEQKIIKRVFDIIVSLIGLIITSPIMLIAMLAIYIDDKGSVFFKQERYTYNRKVFNVIKFRTMYENVENYSVVENDDRITRVGAFLRKTRLDELPQLINVLKGDMSLVGPRPEMLENVHKYEKEFPEFKYRLKVKAGVTGIAQIDGKYNTTPEDKLLMDLLYIENFSFWNDIKILLRTVIVLFKRDSTEEFQENEEN